MNTKILLALVGMAVLVSGCVGTVSGRRTAGVPFVKDRVEGRYERPVDAVFTAAKEVVRFNGTLLSESTHHTETNLVRTVEGRVNQRLVWVRVEQIDPKISAVAVQTRIPGGAADIDLAHELEKQIALKLVR
jgi:hypothetical protein